MKKSELIFNLFSIPVDIIMLLCAGIISFYLRQHSVELIGPIIYELDLNTFIQVSYKIILVLIAIFALLGLYNLRGTRKFADELGKIIIGVSLGLLIVILLFFFNRSIFPSRFIILATWGLGIIFVVMGRLGIKLLQSWFFSKGIGLHKLAVITGGSKEAPIVERLFRKRQNGYEVVGEYTYSANLISDLEKLYFNGKLDEILQANYSLPEEVNLKLVEFARNKGLQFSFVPNLFEVQRNSVETYNVYGIPVIALKNTPLDGWGKVVKRILDILLSSLCLLITLPIFIIIALAIKLDSKGKIIYSAMRGGRGKDFKFYKFRSMYSHLSVGEEYGGQQAEAVRKKLWQKNDRGGENGPFLKIKHDPRVTRVGRFLRKTKLDEIPQFWNVLKGDMSMTGPRAHVLDEVARYKNRYLRMFSIKPGVFGLSQIAQFTWPDLPFEEEIRLNTFYIENWSVWLDLKILSKSFWLLFFSKRINDDY